MAEQDHRAKDRTAHAAPEIRRFDVCNGDADGLCAVVQWRLHEPAAATLVTGLKREIALLERVPAGAGDEVLVCDLSMERNRAALLRLLEGGARVRYFDHHAPGDVPRHPALEAHIDVASGVCTSSIVDRHLGGRFRAWAVVGAFGDNMSALAEGLAESIGLRRAERERLRMLGGAINYNAYGESDGDVHIAPARLYPMLARYRDPLEFVEREQIAHDIDALRRADLAQGLAQRPHWQGAGGAVYLLPDAAWSRRVIGSLANELALLQPRRAHVVARPAAGDTLVVSVRAPVGMPTGAGELCRRFGGSGRAAAAGIDRLPVDELERFVREFAAMRWGADAAARPSQSQGGNRR